jgi:molecular chaperone DnaK (HSP70)
MKEIIIGIDLGTTNSEIAVVENGQITVIDVDQSQLLPSVVGIDEQGKMLVGQSAKNQYALYPERSVKSIKRSMGSDESVVLNGNSFLPQEISALILKRLKQVAETYLGEQVHKAVITVPAYFSDVQRQATREAGEIAGLDVVRMINEPTAAALAYQLDSENEQTLLVYDLGGGTFDVSVVSIQKGVTEVLSSHGNNQLGGDDFDAKISGFILDHLKGKGVDLDNDAVLLAKIDRIAEESKCSLSDEPYVQIEEEYMAQANGEPVHLKTELARDDYETMIQPFIDETMEAVHTALEGAKLTINDIDEIVLVGGSTRTPLVQNSLQKLLGKRPHSEINPDLCVATGAAIQAANIAGENIASILVDITPYTFGTSALGELDGEYTSHKYVPIIHKNTALPCKKTEVFYTNVDDQEKVEVNIFEGEDKNALNNIPLGQFMVTGLSEVPSGNPITITLDLDLDGVLQVTAKEKNTGLSGSLTIENAMQKRNQEDIEQAKNKIDSLFDSLEVSQHMPDSDQNQANDTPDNKTVVKAQALVEKAERMMDSLSDENKEDMVDLIESVNDAIAANDMAKLSETEEELTDMIYYMET